MKKAYIQPEVELLSLASFEDFLDASQTSSTDPSWGDENVGDGGNDFEDKWS